MPRFSSAYSDLIRRVKEVESIVAMARGIRPVTQAHITRNKALCRGGIVLLCSHIEGFIEALGTLAVTRIADNAIPKSSLAPAFRYHLSQDLINGVKEAATPEVFVSSLDHLLYRDANVWDNSVHFSQPLRSDVFVGRFATPRHNDIVRFFRRFGYNRFENELGSRLQRDFLACKNMIDHVVDQRNKIAHGDPLVYGTPSELSDMCRLVLLYCRQTDQVVGDWFRSKGCPIR